jgi:hypothetical protein
LDPCPGCGMTNHKLADCRLDGHPHYNKTTNVPWLNGTWGVRYAAAGKTCLKYGMDEKGNKIEMRQSAAPLKKRSDREEKKKFQKKREYHAHGAIILASIASVNTKSNSPAPHMQLKTLLDTGAVMGNYCSKAVGDWLRATHPDCWSDVDSGEDVALAAEGSSTTPLGHCIIDLILKKKDTVSKHVLFKLDMTVLDITMDIKY